MKKEEKKKPKSTFSENEETSAKSRIPFHQSKAFDFSSFPPAFNKRYLAQMHPTDEKFYTSFLFQLFVMLLRRRPPPKPRAVAAATAAAAAAAAATTISVAFSLPPEVSALPRLRDVTWERERETEEF